VQTTSSRLVYRNAWMSVREDEVVLPDGRPGLYGVVDKPDFALVVPREDDGDVWLVEQYRYPTGRRSWEFPQGSWPASGAGDTVELARTELREETGLRAAQLRHLGRLHERPASASQLRRLARHGTAPGPPEREVTEQGMRTLRVSDGELRRNGAGRRARRRGSLAALCLWRPALVPSCNVPCLRAPMSPDSPLHRTTRRTHDTLDVVVWARGSRLSERWRWHARGAACWSVDAGERATHRRTGVHNLAGAGGTAAGGAAGGRRDELGRTAAGSWRAPP
jgi:hypothetical protein